MKCPQCNKSELQADQESDVVCCPNCGKLFEPKDFIDVLIPTKNPEKIRPNLLSALNEAPWVHSIIIETSKPLSTARVEGAKKCSTEWIAMFDDDIDLPKNWLGAVIPWPIIQSDVLAVSTPSRDAQPQPHILAYQRVTSAIKPVESRDTPFVDNTFILRSALLDYHPPRVFYSEDELLYRYIKSKGRWIHPPYCGVRHFYIQKDNVRAAEVMEQLGFYPFFRFLRGRLSYFILPFLAVAYSHTWKTVPFFWKWNVQLIAGWLKAKVNKTWT